MNNNTLHEDITFEEDGHSEDVNNLYKSIILPNCIDLDWAQIIYAISIKRLLFINCYQTWSHFHSENSENAIKYNDFTTEELCYRFLQRVLPNIYDYELTEVEIHLLNLLDLHPNFERISTGFKIMEQTESLIFPTNESVINALVCSKEEKFYALDVKLNDQIIRTNRNSMWRKFNFNAENAAFLSIALCSDKELPNCELLTIKESFKRLKAAKSQFENMGEQLVNVNIPLNELLKKLETIHKLKEAVTKLVNISFCQYNADK